MYIEFTEGKMFYNVYNKGKALVFLHGWGQNGDTFNSIIKHFFNYQVIVVDLLGFGKSDVPNKPLTLDDYTSHLISLFNYLKITNPIIIGHSFGGRIAIDYCAKKHTKEKLILLSSAGIRKKHNISYLYKVYKYKFKKHLYKIFSSNKYENLVKNSGSEDFKNAVPVMKKTMINVVNTDQRKMLKSIENETLLLWGINDKTTPFSDAVIMSKTIKSAVLIPFYASGHFCYIDEENKVIKSIIRFIEGDSNECI